MSGACTATDTCIDSAIGVVVIGRNEGERLKHCLSSVGSLASRVVYVDSRSRDGSAEWARKQGVAVVELDSAKPLSAARARNEGFRRLTEIAPELSLVQFLDGDCEMDRGWLSAAHGLLTSRPEVAAVCGRLRERFPEHSIYNMLCEMEWNGPVGETRSTGGNAMMRCSAFRQVNGYREDLIAGEEPELCVRLRAGGWKIWRLGDEMGLHDAAITRFGQWWKRAVRGGHAFAQGAWLHGAPPERHCVAETRRAVLWGAVLPLAILSLAAIHPAWLMLALAYPLQVLRLAVRGGIGDRERRWRALFLVIARFAEAQGVLKFWIGRLRRRSAALIEYKQD